MLAVSQLTWRCSAGTVHRVPSLDAGLEAATGCGATILVAGDWTVTENSAHFFHSPVRLIGERARAHGMARPVRARRSTLRVRRCAHVPGRRHADYRR